MVPKQGCAFIQYTRRSAAEAAAEKSFNKLFLKARRLTIRWGRSQGKQQTASDAGAVAGPMVPVPGLPGALPQPPEELTNNFFNLVNGQDEREICRHVWTSFFLFIFRPPRGRQPRLREGWRHLHRRASSRACPTRTSFLLVSLPRHRVLRLPLLLRVQNPLLRVWSPALVSPEPSTTRHRTPLAWGLLRLARRRNSGGSTDNFCK